jgi:putative FmdB family regulatory protein
MPTYEYECQKCGHIFDEFQSITAPPVAYCPQEGCGGEAKRRFSPGAGFIFKGSGFYGTDYRSESYKKAAKADGSTPPSSGASSSETGKGSGSSAAPASSPPPASKD